MFCPLCPQYDQHDTPISTVLIFPVVHTTHHKLFFTVSLIVLKGSYFTPFLFQNEIQHEHTVPLSLSFTAWTQTQTVFVIEISVRRFAHVFHRGAKGQRQCRSLKGHRTAF